MDQLADLVEGITLEPTALLDIALTALLIYGVFSLIQGTRAVRLVIGAIVLYLLYVLAQALELRLLSGIMQTGAVVGLLALVVVFQPELRRALERIGRFGSLGWITAPGGSAAAVERVARTLARTAVGLSASRTGALIVVERESSLDDTAETGVLLRADLSEELLASIFTPHGALHDGAVIVRGDRILAAGAVLPLSEASAPRERYGTRHRAALGITEQTDAIAVVVSEESGRISLAERGRVLRDLDEERLRARLVALLRPADGRGRAAAGISAIGRGTFARGKRPRVLRRRDPGRSVNRSDRAGRAGRGRRGTRGPGSPRVRRALAFLVRNWPLKLAALGLASVLYAGVVLSENSRAWPGEVTIAVVDPPAGAVLLAPPGAVTSIHYRAPLDLAGQLTRASFRASVDLSGLTPVVGGAPVEVPVGLVAVDPRVQIVDFAPRSVEVRLDSVVSRTMPVSVERGVAPEGLVLGPPQVEPSSVLLRGASSRLAQVRSVIARVVVDASGLNVDQVVDLEVVDEAGDLVPDIEVTPSSARVRIDVARELAYAVLPVQADITGTPAAGYRVGSVMVDPTTVTVSGEAPAVARLTSIATAPVSVEGLSADRTQTVSLLLPADITLIGDAQALLSVGIVPSRGSRALEAGLVLRGARRDRVTSLSVPSVLVTLSGPVGNLDALEAGLSGVLVGEVPVAGLGNGRHEVPVEVTPPDGITVVSVSPRTVVVRIAPPAETPTPSPSGEPSAAPSATLAASVPPSGGADVTRAAVASPSASPDASGGP